MSPINQPANSPTPDDDADAALMDRARLIVADCCKSQECPFCLPGFPCDVVGGLAVRIARLERQLRKPVPS